MKLSEIFKLARERIESGDNTLICFALHDANRFTNESTKATLRALAIIEGRLDGCATLNLWLMDQMSRGLIPYDPLIGGAAGGREGPKFQEKMRATRLAWLDSLIAECEAEGD